MTTVGHNRVWIITLIFTILFSCASTTGFTQQAQDDLTQYYPDVLFTEDFDHPGRYLWEWTETWHLATDGNNSYMAGEYFGNTAKSNWLNWNFRYGVETSIYNYTVESDFKIDSGSLYVEYRETSEPPKKPPYRPYYKVMLTRTDNNLTIDIEKVEALVQPAHDRVEIPFSDGWHKMDITGRGGELQVKIDGRVVMTYIDDQDPYLYGRVAFVTPPSSKIAIDNLKILGGSDILYKYPANTPLVLLVLAVIIIIILALIFKGFSFIRKKLRPSNVKQESGLEAKKSESSPTIPETHATQPVEPEKGTTMPQTGMVGHDVFISYSHEDKPVADAICSGLEVEGIKCWIAPRDVLPGAIFQDAIIDAIDGSSIMVVVYSSKSNSSPHVVRELTRAVSKDVIIIPFRIEDVPLSKTMEYLISVPHWLDALTPPLDAHIKELVKVVKANLDIKRKRSN